MPRQPGCGRLAGVWLVVVRPPTLAGGSQTTGGGPRLSPRELSLYLHDTQDRLARVGTALAESAASSQPDLEQLERHLVQLLSRLAMQWERRN
jgi:hypothetical protein